MTTRTTMRAVAYDRYGPPEVLRIERVERPVPKEDEALVRVHASTVTRSDTGGRSAEYFVARPVTGLFRPRRGRAGFEFAGEVEAIGAGVTRFAVGDRVFGLRSGSNADYVCVREAGVIAHVPADIGLEDAVAVPDGACTALSMLRQARVPQRERIVVYGATGSIGTAAVQLAKHLGAHVTAVGNTKNLDLVRSLGADEVVDYLNEDFTENGETYDLVFDTVGKESFWRCRGSLRPGGLFMTAGGSLWRAVPPALLTKWIGSRKATLGIARYSQDDLLLVRELLEAGEYRPVIDRTYALEDVVEAHRYVDSQQKTGNVVLTIAHG